MENSLHETVKPENIRAIEKTGLFGQETMDKEKMTILQQELQQQNHKGYWM